jgi:hypothetical protein
MLVKRCIYEEQKIKAKKTGNNYSLALLITKPYRDINIYTGSLSGCGQKVLF